MRIGLTGILVDDQDHAKDAQQLYVVPASDLVLVRFGRDVGDRHRPQLLSDLARRLDEIELRQGAMTPDSVLHKRLRPWPGQPTGSPHRGAGRVDLRRGR